MIFWRRFAIAVLVFAVFSLLGGCDLLVAPAPFEAPTESVADEDDSISSTPTEPTEPSEPSDPTEPTEPSDPSDPSDPSTDGQVSEEPGVTITPTTVGATEGGPDGNYQVVLTTEPTAEVTVSTTVTNGEATVSPSSLTFTSANWDTAQTVTVSAVNDEIAEGAHSDTVTHSVASGDADYEGITPEDVTVSIVDNDSAGVSITPLSITATEGGPDGNYQVVLTTEPTAEVTVSPSATNGQVTVSVPSLTFNAATWDTPQTVTVSAVDDEIAEGAHSDTVTHSVASGDADYEGITAADVTVSIVDNDSAGVSITPLSITVTEGGVDGFYEVVLTTEPTLEVTLSPSATNGQVTVSVPSLTFNAATWDTPQTVTVSAEDDEIVEGDHSDTVTHGATSGDPNYDGLGIPDVAVDIADNDVIMSFADNRAELGDVNATLFGSAPGELVVEVGSVVTIPGNADGPFIQGYIFQAWNTSADGSGTSYSAGTDLTVTGDITLFAQWAGGPGNYGAAFSGGDGTLGNPYQISSAAELYNVGHRDFIDQGVHYQQSADIDLGVAPWNEGDGWPGVGDIGTTRFDATFDGNGHTISNLTVYNRFGTTGALFPRASAATIRNVALENVNIQSRRGFVGAILGAGNSLGTTTITDSYATGTIVVDNALGGGTPGTNDRNVGGLVGYGINTQISRSFADVTVSNTGQWTGGLVGQLMNSGFIHDSYALGDVTGIDTVGGLLGQGTAVERSYSVGVVSGSTNVGGLVGSGSTDNESFYNSDTSGQTDTDKGAPRTTAQMLQESTFTNWDFTGGVGPWAINENASYPYHQWYTGPVPTP